MLVFNRQRRKVLAKFRRTKLFDYTVILQILEGGMANVYKLTLISAVPTLFKEKENKSSKTKAAVEVGQISPAEREKIVRKSLYLELSEISFGKSLQVEVSPLQKK